MLVHASAHITNEDDEFSGAEERDRGRGEKPPGIVFVHTLFFRRAFLQLVR